MHFSYTHYKHSVLATVCSAFGMTFIISGISGLVNAMYIGALICFAIGALLLFLAPKANKRAVRKKMMKSLKDPELIRRIRQSAVAAYALFKNAPTIVMLQYLAQYNPEAAKLITDKLDGHMSEEELIEKLRSMDEVAEQQICDTQSSSGKIYENEMFQLENVKTVDEQRDEACAELSMQQKISRVWLKIGIPVLWVSAVAFIVCLMLSTSIEKEPIDIYDARTGDYVQLETDAIRQYKTEDGYVYFRVNSWASWANFRIPETETDQLYTVFRVDKDDPDRRTSRKPVSIYGVVRNVDGVAVLDGSLEPEMRKNAPMPWTAIALALMISSAICLIVFLKKYLSAKKALVSLVK